MVLKTEIASTILEQEHQLLPKKSSFIPREKLDTFKSRNSLIEVITGIRRCGKSTLLKQLMRVYKKPLFLNFEDPRIFDFSVHDFPKLEELGKDCDAWFLDEIQNVEGWEIFVRKLHDRGEKVFVTGSNASLLSRELGTKLTGRHLRKELFPFSYKEYLAFHKKKHDTKLLKKYLFEGGLPEFLKFRHSEIHQQLLKDVVLRDIAVRHNIKNSNQLLRLALYVLTEVGKPYSLENIARMLEIPSTSTVKNYLDWLEDAYLIRSIPVYSPSSKASIRIPRKIYSIDNGLSASNSISFSKDQGRLLENTIAIFLARENSGVYYFKGKKECDFVLTENRKVTKCIQVCLEIHSENQQREISGLLEALQHTGLKQGYIVTLAQDDRMHIEGKTIHLVNAGKFMLDHTH